MMSYRDEILADEPIGHWLLGAAPPPAQVDLSGKLWTLERGHPFTTNGDIVTVIATTEKAVRSAYVNGVKVATDHPYAVDLIRDWEPPAHGSSGAAVFDRALTLEQIKEHHAAHLP